MALVWASQCIVAVFSSTVFTQAGSVATGPNPPPPPPPQAATARATIRLSMTAASSAAFLVRFISASSLGMGSVKVARNPGRAPDRARPWKCLGASPDARTPSRCQTESVYQAASILIVDDHDGFRRFARGMLEAAGFTVAEAATGAEAAEAARSVRPGLVLLDIQLPDSDGFEVARRLAQQAAGRPGGPVIVLTSTREASDYGARITSSPAAGFLPKDQLSGAALRRFLT